MSDVMDIFGEVGRQLDELGTKADVVASNGSIGSFLSGFVVNPRIVVSDSLRDSEELDKVIELNLNVFSMMYARAFDILISVYGFNSKFAMRTLGNGATWTLEDMNSLDAPSYEVCAEKCVFPLDMHHASVENKLATNVVKEIELSAKPHHAATGREMNITLKMLLKATIVYTDQKEIYTAIDTSGDKVSFGYRLDEYRSGAITLGNLIFSNDLIKEYKKNRLKEKSDFLKFIEARRKKNLSTLAIRRTVDMSKMFQMLIVSKKDMIMIQKLVGGIMKKDRIKDKVLDSILSMSITSIDDDHETVDIYLGEIPGAIELSFSALHKGGENQNELIKWMLANK